MVSSILPKNKQTTLLTFINLFGLQKATIFILKIILNFDPKWKQGKVKNYCNELNSTSFSSHFFLLLFCLTKLPKTKIDCMIFCAMFSFCKARQNWKIIKQTNKLFKVIISFFITFVNQNEKRKMGWKAHKSTHRVDK